MFHYEYNCFAKLLSTEILLASFKLERREFHSFEVINFSYETVKPVIGVQITLHACMMF